MLLNSWLQDNEKPKEKETQPTKPPRTSIQSPSRVDTPFRPKKWKQDFKTQKELILRW